MIFETKYTFMEQGPRGETYEGQKSLTQPDEVMSIKEMLQRHARGLPVSGGNEGVYFDESLGYIPDPASLDLVEIKEWQDKFKARHDEIKASQDAAKKKAKEDADFKRFKEKLDKEKKDEKPPAPPVNPSSSAKGESA